MTTPVQQAREALGARLREIRKDADLTARALAAAMGSHFTKVSKIENGARSPTEQDIRSWCTACEAAGQIPDLIATVRHIEAMYHEYRRQMQAGLRHLTESSVPLYEQTSLFRIYDTTVVPGLFTTAEYAAALFRFWTGFMGLADDVDAAVQARLDRQRVLYTGEREFRVVVEEQVLRTRVGDADVMAGQLDRLLAVMLAAEGQDRDHPGRGRAVQPDPGELLDVRRLAGPHRDRLGQPDHHPAARYHALRPGLRAAPAVGAVRARGPAPHRPRAPRLAADPD